ncbi:hypothetical protein [Mycobacterium sp. PSTR-4-N]|uniref:hypothetical protein n=1 Tax=Mycobacterium sp. PSTR-4-N TaxID=2917745 RepID=UPI001F14BBD6|nr:hypothetical protein [Mycobacterium sp. PSTR-4-N]MCG7592429.1 hypothetical protein [Mycobacterium sp. PSTR-4-N]
MAPTTAVTQYAVKVGDRGWATGWGNNVSAEEPVENQVGASRKSAVELADQLRGRYEALGAPEIAAEVEVMQRTLTRSYSEWASVTASEAQPAATELPPF